MRVVSRIPDMSNGTSTVSGAPIRVAFGSVPKDSGTFTFYRNLRPVLRTCGIDLRCVSVGYEQMQLWEEEFADEGCVSLAIRSVSIKRQAQVFVDWCESENIDIVMGINSEAILSAIPHLPERVRVLSRCANGFEHGYRITLSGSERLARIVALTPRLRDDLISKYGVDPERIVLIPNGIDPVPFTAGALRSRGQEERLQLGFLGRLEHNQKGVLHLPAIVAELKKLSVPFHLRIAGKGRHEPELRKALAYETAEGLVEFSGSLTPADIPEFLEATDVFLFTSHFEGCPNALLEAMMAGTVPVSWHLEGITDFVIDDGRSGLLCETGNTRAFAKHIAGLHGDRERLDALHRNAAEAAKKRFASEVAADAYAELFHSVMVTEPPSWKARPWTEFIPDPNFSYTWRRYVPRPIKSMFHRLAS